MFIYAHRGASGEFPENTLLAFEQAITQGADGIELDVMQVGEELFVYHDRYLDKVGMQGHGITSQTEAQVAQLEVAKGHNIPRLNDALRCIGHRCVINIEVKCLGNIQLLADAIASLVGNGEILAENLVISSFDHPMLLALHKKLPAIHTAPLTASIPIALAQCFAPLNAKYWHVDVNVINAKAVQAAHQAGMQVMVYTVDRQSDLIQLRDMGVDGVFTNYPARSRAILSA